MVDLEPDIGGAACHAAVSISLQHRLARPLPGPAVAAPRGVVLLVAWAPAQRCATRTARLWRQGVAVQAAPHSLSPALTPLPERADASANGCRVGRVAEEDVAEPALSAATQACTVSDRTIGLREPPVMNAPAHG